MARILIVDDELNLRKILRAMLSDDGHEVVEAGGVTEARRAFSTMPLDLVITDQRMKDGEGLDLLASCREVDATVPVVLLTAYATVELAVDAMRQGAFDFIPKPFVPDAVRAVVRRACERAELMRENESLRGQVRRFYAPEELVGESAPMRMLRELVARIAPTNATVLVQGETGTGKELVARAIHASSPRSDRAFIALNCAGLTESLLESELFGHERGAFTGADRARQGVFEAAHRGTLFLDEAGEMSLALQAKLLRVLVNREVTRVGSTVPRFVDVRIVSATNRELEALVRAGQFREDLYYRLAVVPIRVPALRDRRGDLPLLVRHLLTAVSHDLKLPVRTVSPEAMARLSAYAFPGNVRELRNLLERATILARGPRIEADDLPVPVGEIDGRGPVAEGVPSLLGQLPDTIDLPAVLAEIEESLLQRALDAAAGVKAEAARRLGISRSHLDYKLRLRGRRDRQPE